MEIEFKVRISPEEKQQEFLAALAMSGGVILSSLLLGLFFAPLYLLGFFFISCFSTFQKIRVQEKLPDTIRLEDNNLIFFSRGKMAISIPLQAIANVEYKQGIIIRLKKPPGARIHLAEPSLLNKKYGDFYFEWFEPKAFSLIQSRIKTSLNNVVHPN